MSALIALLLSLSAMAQDKDAGTADAAPDADIAETVEVIKALQNGTLETKRVKPDEVSSSCPGYVAFEKKYFDSILTANRYIVNSCADSVTDTAPKKVAYTLKQLCKKGGNPDGSDSYAQAPVSYNIKREEDTSVRTHFTISQKIRFNIQPANPKARPEEILARANEMVARAKQCGGVITEVWRRYGIKFNLELDSEQAKSKGEPDESIAMIDGQCRSHAQMFCYGGLPEGPRTFCDQKCNLIPKSTLLDPRGACLILCEKEIRQKEFCLMILHESGHLVGLPDEYEDTFTCKDRAEISKETDPTSVMGLPWVGYYDLFDQFGLRHAFGVKNSLEFFPRHVRKILKPYPACSSPQ